jgi:molybdopterin synthase catalytic subunit
LIEITKNDFDTNKILQSMRNENTGAVLSFIGTVRGFTDILGNNGQTKRTEIKLLNYECYKEMALEKLAQIRDYALTNYNINDMHLIHRTGTLKPTEQVVMIAVSAAHRKDAFQACEYAIEELKKSVPMWKKEITADMEYWVGENKLATGGNPKRKQEEGL